MIVGVGIQLDLTWALYSYYCITGIVRRADLGKEFRVYGGGWSNGKYDNLWVSQFQGAGWPDTLGKHL